MPTRLHCGEASHRFALPLPTGSLSCASHALRLADLTEEYKRITEQFKDLQAKFQHFEVADTKRYRDVWQMNEVCLRCRLSAAHA